MALQLIAPGQRKGNKFYLARGSVLGKVYEFNCYTTDAKLAKKRLAELDAEIRQDAVPSGERMTFAQAAQLYIEFRRPAKVDMQRIERVVTAIGNRRIQEIRGADLHDLALKLFPDCASSTRNRELLRPALTVLHHAANSGLCQWLKVKAFREPKPVTRALDPAAAASLIQAAPAGPQRALLMFLFYQGTRVSATLALRWDQIDLENRTVRLFNRKGDRWEVFPLHDATIAELTNLRKDAEIGSRVFPWSNKTSLRRWLPQLCERVGIKFTPHMARHTLGTALARDGATLKVIMAALGHSTASSSLRYQAADIEMVRAATAKINLPIAAK